MKKKKNKTLILLILYIAVVTSVSFWIFFPLLVAPSGLAQSKVPTLSVSGLRESERLFTSAGKVWIDYPIEPDLTNYVFGQRDPM